MFGAIAGALRQFSPCRLSPSERGTAVKKSILLLSSLVAGGALMGAGAAKAALVNDLVTFTGSGITSAFGQAVPTDPVTGSFTITFDPTLTYVDQTTGITLNSLNISLVSALSFDYSPNSYTIGATTFGAGELVVGGVESGACCITLPSTDPDFYLQILTVTTTPAFNQLGYLTA